MSVKVRLMGLHDEVEMLTEQLGDVARVVERSEPYKNRGASELVRVYVEIELLRPATARQGSAPRRAREGWS
jgi:hypothetical protein